MGLCIGGFILDGALAENAMGGFVCGKQTSHMHIQHIQSREHSNAYSREPHQTRRM
jgi:hypothetical protein